MADLHFDTSALVKYYVQLAVALRYRGVLDTLQRPLTFVSGDRTVLTAAGSEGLLTDNPFDHVSPLDTAPPPVP